MYNLYYILRAVIFTLSLFCSFAMCNPQPRKALHVKENENVLKTDSSLFYLKLRADSAKVFCNKKQLNTDYCMLIDFNIHSGKNRFFVWDFANDTIKYQALCCHGYGGGSTRSTPVFSNVEGSYCSSLGKYKLGIRSYSSYGIHIHYKMHGLESSNSNAYKRVIVLHSHTPMPAQEIFPNHLPLGWSLGCPVIDNNTMLKIDELLKKQTKPMLLWIYH